jgi:aspartyl-tRNA(Asn)/glutamyl-tRNA(Gln) amidotransferase subunit A
VSSTDARDPSPPRSHAQDAPTATELAADVRAGRADPVELVERALARLAACDPALSAFVHVAAERARAEAADRRAAVRRGEPAGPLCGVPVAVKDLFDVTGEVSRAGSRVPAGPPAERDAPAVARLRRAGAVVLGRTRTHEFAWGLTTQHPDLGGTRNPWDTGRVPGGSSGGSAAAVAAGVVPLALGTDTGCSIRLPAAWCGLVGHKPSYAAVPLDGVVPLATSLDHAGALVRDAADARLALSVLQGRALPPPQDLAGLRLGVVEPAERTAGVAAALATGTARATGLARSARTVALPLADELPRLYARVQAREALAWHRSTGRWPAHAQAYGEDVRGRLEACERLTDEQYAAAEQLRERLRREVGELFEQIDLLLLPVATCGPSPTTTPDVSDIDGEPVPIRTAVLPWTVLANLCGLPACSVPVGLDDDGLPVGLQVVGPAGADARVLDAAAALQVPLRPPAEPGGQPAAG